MVARFHMNFKLSVQQWPHTLTVLNPIAPLPRHKSLTKAEGESKDLQCLFVLFSIGLSVPGLQASQPAHK